ncbi:peroxiredoxin [Fragilaria crotonensis]|nr:peroxiredoxin [Fragilaria crotonensis]
MFLPQRLLSITKTRTTFMTMRSITIGSDLKTCEATWQKARPWYNSAEEGLNTAVDNVQTMKDVFAGKTVAVFGVPAPFTGTCTHAHYPPYKRLADDFLAAGVDKILCYSVSDPYAMHGWAKTMGNDFDKIQFVADVDALWAKEMALDHDYSGVSLSVRSKRFSMVVKDGIVKSFHLVGEAEKDADVLLEDVKQL